MSASRWPEPLPGFAEAAAQRREGPGRRQGADSEERDEQRQAEAARADEASDHRSARHSPSRPMRGAAARQQTGVKGME